MSQVSEPVYDTGPGEIRARLEYWGFALRLFSQRTQNAIVREAMRRAGEFYIAVFIPQKFDRAAKALPPGYSSSKAWEQNKINLAKRGVISGPQPTPLVFTGLMRHNLIGGSRADARATKNRAYVIIRMPIGHAVRPKLKQVLRWLPAYQVKRIAEVVEQQLTALLFSDEEKDTIPRVPAAAPRKQSQKGTPRAKAPAGADRRRVA